MRPMRPVAGCTALLLLALAGCPRPAPSGAPVPSQGDASGKSDGSATDGSATGGGAGGVGGASGGGAPTVRHSSESRPSQPLGGGDLLVNGGADADFVVVARGVDGDKLGPPGWTLGADAQVTPYDVTDRVTTAMPGPPQRGGQHFMIGVVGDQVRPHSTARQTIDVAAAAADIDAGAVRCALSGWFEADERVTVQLVATFEDASGAALGAVETTPPAFREAQALERAAAEGAVPRGTRRIQVTLRATGTLGPDETASGWADQLELVLRKG